MSNSRIAYDIPGFKKYVHDADNFFQQTITPTNGERLGVPAASVTELHNRRLEMDTLFTKRESETTDATIITAQVQPFIKSFHQFANPIIDICAASPARTQADATLLNFVLFPNPHTSGHGIINIDFFYQLDARGGGELEVHAHTDSSHGKAHLAPGADSVQTSYTIGNTPLSNPESGNKEVHRSASFWINTGAENRGQPISIRMRWYNTRHPELSGPWTEPRSFIIL